mmetsp:Transcript_23266/g.51193  ORF Transcript_23266/g.51193 Transcript_23266/m.51193 type:complete len:115 (-) Transcript_23266:267-611(-)
MDEMRKIQRAVAGYSSWCSKATQVATRQDDGRHAQLRMWMAAKVDPAHASSKVGFSETAQLQRSLAETGAAPAPQPAPCRSWNQRDATASRGPAEVRCTEAEVGWSVVHQPHRD